MNQPFVETFAISNVYQKERYKSWIDIYFTVDGFKYSLMMKKTTDKFEAWGVHHESSHNCPVCSVVGHDGYALTCQILDKQRHALFHQLIEHPSIRLEWLYIPHHVKA